MIVMTNIRRQSKLLARFSRGEDGSIAVEGAMAMSVLAVCLIGIVDVGHYVTRGSQMDHALRSTAQYVVNGGEDLSVASQLFTDIYGSGATMTTGLKCACARPRSSYLQTTDPNTNVTSSEPLADQQTEEVASARANGAWNSCSLQCGDQTLVKYVSLKGEASVQSLLAASSTTISEKVYVRVE